MLQVLVARKNRQISDFCFTPLVFLDGMKQEPKFHLCLRAIEKMLILTKVNLQGCSVNVLKFSLQQKS